MRTASETQAWLWILLLCKFTKDASCGKWRSGDSTSSFCLSNHILLWRYKLHIHTQSLMVYLYPRSPQPAGDPPQDCPYPRPPSAYDSPSNLHLGVRPLLNLPHPNANCFCLRASAHSPSTSHGVGSSSVYMLFFINDKAALTYGRAE